MLKVGRLAFGIQRISAAVIMMTVAPALRSAQDKLNLNSKVLKLFFSSAVQSQESWWVGGRAVGRVPRGGWMEELEGDGEER